MSATANNVMDNIRAMLAAEQRESKRQIQREYATGLLKGKTLVCACWMGRGAYTLTRHDVLTEDGIERPEITEAMDRLNHANSVQRGAAHDHLRRVVERIALNLVREHDVFTMRGVH